MVNYGICGQIKQFQFRLNLCTLAHHIKCADDAMFVSLYLYSILYYDGCEDSPIVAGIYRVCVCCGAMT